MLHRLRFPLFAAIVFAAHCSSSTTPSGGSPGATPLFDLHADLTQPETFWNLPWPSDLRLTADGAPDLRGFPNQLTNAVVRALAGVSARRKGFAQLTAGYFTMSAPIAPRSFGDVIPADASQPLLLVDVDANSPERGKLFPLVAETAIADRYVPDNFLAMASRPGVLLHPKRAYAFVVRRSLHDANGALLGVPAAFAALQSATPPPADPELAAWKLYQPLWPTLKQIGVDAGDVAAASVFTTGDPVQDLADMSAKLAAANATTITGLKVRQDGAQTRNCEIVGTASMPQFQKGAPLFDTGGDFELGPDGLPVKQRDETIPIAISLPQAPMPANGYPLVVYIHGSGGLSTQLFDRGQITASQPNGVPHQGPAYVLAPFGFAVAGAAMPVNPERVPGASDLAYINFNNLAAFPFTFQQGVIEQRILIDALSKLTVDPQVVASCTGMSLPSGATSYKLDLTRLAVQGQSMGAQYANLVSAVDPRVGALAPSGAGGYWSYVVLTTKAVANASGQVGLLLGTTNPITVLHPASMLLETAWEPADAIVFTPRLARLPLDGHPARSIYEPAGKDDEYFQTPIYDAMALAYGHKEAGDAIWPSMQDALKLEGLDGFVQYPISQDLKSSDKKPYTGAIIQYAGDGVADPHYIFQQLDAVKYQYGCFFATYVKTGTATIPAPAALGTPCPGM